MIHRRPVLKALVVAMALGLGAAGPAAADPFSAVAALSTFAASAAGTGYFLTLSSATWFYVGVAASVLGAVNNRRRARAQQAAAKAEVNAALKDRTATVLTSDPPWQVIYGRCIVGGFYSDIITTDKLVRSEVGELGDEVARPDSYKTNVIGMASHQVQSFHEVFIDGVPVGPVDGDGWAAVGASATVTFTAATNLVNWTATPAGNGHAVTFAGGTLPTGLTAGQIYYVRDKTANGFKLATSPGGAEVDFSTDGSGTITGTLRSPFFAQNTGFRILTFTDEVTFDEGPLESVLSAYTGEGAAQTPVTVTIESGNRLVSAIPDVEVTVNFSFTRDQPTVRVVPFLGAADQATPAYLDEIAPARYTSNHRLRSCAGVVLTVDLEDVRFQGGPPQITADISGRLLYDPRDASTAWSDNPALVIRDFLTAEWGFGVSSDDVDDGSVIAAADACDELIDLVVGSTTTADQPRYTCNGAFRTDASKEKVLEELADSMAGAVSYGATYRLLAGTWTEPVMALTDDDLHGQIEVVQSDTPMGLLFNGMRGQLFLAGAQSPSDFNPYQNSTFVAADGRALWTSTSLPYTNHLARARNLCRVSVERNRAGQVIRFPAKLRAWPLEVGDRVTVSSAEYGLSDKAYRVTDWQFDVTSAVILTLQEDAEEIYDLADAAVADPTPNTDLADPWLVPGVTGVSATSGTATMWVQADGTILPRVVVEWDPVDSGGVVSGGRVEVLWRGPNTPSWVYNHVHGDEVVAYLYDCPEGDTISIEVRARNALGQVGPSTFISHLVLGKSAPPSDVTGFTWSIKPGLVQFRCNKCPDADYKLTELRYLLTEPDYDAGDWEAAAFLAAGAGTEYHHPRPDNGTYWVLAKHQDTSDNYSTNAAYLEVVVDDSIDPVGLRGSLIGYSNSVTPPIYMAGTEWDSPTDDANAATIIWQMLGNTGTPPDNTHLRIGDTVTLSNAAGTASDTRYWGGSSWLEPGVVISGNLVVGGTISGGTNIEIDGTARFKGMSSAIAIPAPGEGPIGPYAHLYTTAVLANEEADADVGVVGVAASDTGVGLAGVNFDDADGGIGVYGWGRTGVHGSGNSEGGVGVRGDAPLADTIGVLATSNLVGFGGPSTSIALKAEHTGGGVALQVDGRIVLGPVVSTLPPGAVGAFAIHETYGLIWCVDGVTWLTYDAPIIDIGTGLPMVVLQHYDGDFTDSSAEANVFSAQAGAVTSSTRAKFGSQSFIANGSHYATCPDSPAFSFGTRLWSIDFWLYIPTATTLATDNTLVCSWGTGVSTSNAVAWYLGINSSGYLHFFHSNNGTSHVDIRTASAAALPRDTWMHVAIWKSATTGGVVAAIDGAPFNVLGSGFSIFDSTVPLAVLATAAGGAIAPSGISVDELRICVDAIDYDNSSFTPPTSAYPNP